MGFLMALLGLVVAIGIMVIMLKLLDKIGDKWEDYQSYPVLYPVKLF